MTINIRSTLTKVATVIPKPPLSMLRLGAAATPVGVGLLLGSVVAVKAFEHKDEIKSTLGNIVNNAKNAATGSVSTIAKISAKPEAEHAEEPSMLFPILLVGGGLVVLFIVFRK
jgi:hypothetical protein